MARFSRISISTIGASLLAALFAYASGDAVAQSNNSNNGHGGFGDEFGGYGGGVAAPAEPQVPPGLDVFNLDA